MLIEQLITESVLSILLCILLLLLLRYVLKDKPPDEPILINRNDDVQADYDVKVHNIKIRIGD